MHKTVRLVVLELCLVVLVVGCGAQAEPAVDSTAVRQSPGRTTYYIDPIHGDDRHDGLKAERAWRTFGPLGALRLSAGDRVEVLAAGRFDQTLWLRGDGSPRSPVEVHLAAGRYDFHPDRAVKRKYQISNTNGAPDQAKAIGILFDRASHFRLTGPGAKLFFHGKMIEVCLDGCRDIVISDLSFDYHRPTVSEFTVISAGPDHADLKIHKDSWYSIEQGKITWRGEGWQYTTGLAQELDLETGQVWRRRDPLAGLRLEEVGPLTVRAHGKHSMRPQRVYQIRQILRDCAGVFARRSVDITWKNVRFHYMHGMGLVNQFCENLTFDTVTIAPDPAGGRTTAAWADCLQASGCRGLIRVVNCRFSGAHDDAINIHGTYLRLVERLGPTRVRLRFMHKQTFGFLAFNPGDQVELVRADSLQPYGPNRVVEARLVSPTDILLTLAEPLPRDIGPEDVMENVTWTPQVEIRGCTVSRIPTRGFLLATRRKVLVENNRFERTHMSALLIAHDARNWFESGCVRDLTIRGNLFLRCGEPVVRIRPENRLPNDAVQRNIRILDNTFVLRGAVAVGAKSTRGLTVAGNAIYGDRIDRPEQAVQTSDCSQVRIENNRLLPLSAYTSR